MNNPFKYFFGLSFVVFCIFSCYAEAKAAETPEQTATDTAAKQQEYKKDPCTGETGYIDSWLDLTHEYITRNLCEPTVWFDNFLGGERTVADGRPGTFVLWRNTARWSELEGITYFTRVDASVRLPKVKQRLRLFVAGENAGERTDVLPNEPVDPVLEKNPNENRANIGLRYDIIDRPQTKISFDTGVRIIPIEPFVRLRFRYTQPIGTYLVARFTETVLEKTRKGFSETTQIDLERLLNPFTLLRWSSFGAYFENNTGVDWGTGLSLIHQLTPKSSISLDVGASGVTRPATIVKSYRVGSRYRRNFFRPWLYYTVEPEISWPKDENGNWTSVRAFMFSIEILFGR